jgi:hypothetical protein
LLVVALLVGCSGPAESGPDTHEPEPPPTPKTFLDGDLTGALPEQLSEVGLYVTPADRSKAHARAVEFEPAYPLWTNGAEKQRFVVVPEGASIDSSAENWEFPEGTLFFKTFSYATEPGESRPIETRVLRRSAKGYEYSVYLWDEDAADASLLDGKTSTPVAVELEGEEFEHVVPSRLQCRSCHESQEPNVIGFDELRLNSALPGHEETQLDELAAAGVINEAPSAPLSIDEPDALTRDVLGYLQGNCVHCHNGGTGENSAFSMDYREAVANLINVETTSELLHGLRIKPGVPEESALYLALTADPAAMDEQPMPPLGVQRRDEATSAMFEEWILSLPGE